MRILVVEDDYISRIVLEAMLSPWGSVETAVDGAEAFGKFMGSRRLGEPYDLICLDIMMPGMDGMEVLREIRSIEDLDGLTSFAGVKVVMVTALASYNNVAAAFRDQCDGYLTKPLNKDQLESTLAALGFEPARG